tara:strand:+ start:2736 stop:3194 length:459 start_codon:yes stop_codon:yes gene_type:complete
MKIHEYNQMMQYLTRPATPVEREKFNVGNKVEPKNIEKTEKINNEKPPIKMAMSETPAEEADLLLGSEAEQFMEWLKKNKDKTYNDWLKDKKALLTEEQKKDPKIIDLVPYLPFTFDEEIERMLEDENTPKEESYKRGFEEGIASILKVRKV